MVSHPISDDEAYGIADPIIDFVLPLAKYPVLVTSYYEQGNPTSGVYLAMVELIDAQIALPAELVPNVEAIIEWSGTEPPDRDHERLAEIFHQVLRGE